MSFPSAEALGMDLLHRQLPEGDLLLSSADWTGVTGSKVCNAPGIIPEQNWNVFPKMDEEIGAMDGCYLTADTLWQLELALHSKASTGDGGNTAVHPF
ncbi:hypothetical protein IV203_008470 [Nitzschia inconspicua]|uniref:Uncharacterized protein n=1 Tax=Nitzschia inconspicua TaxID=303405 RepID=A0A9K3PM20_9STRA|nr:hypothetical protein IV203_008470 [Nitzschia inconspicua]